MNQPLPGTTAACGGCEEPINVLNPYLKVIIKAERQVLLASQSDDPNAPIESTLGTRRGRGRIVLFHGFDCICDYAEAREGQKAKIEFHEETEIYVPADNRSPEELAEAQANGEEG